jgi:hypothetical protein
MKNDLPSPSSLPKNPAYVYSTGEKLKLLFSCLRQKTHPRTNLLAGPYVGEFGYELMQWQGFVRALRPRYQQVHVLTYPGRDYLYEGCQVHYHDIDLKSAGYWYGRLSPAEARSMADAKAVEIGLTDYDVFDTSLLCTRYHKMLFWRQDFRLLNEPAAGGRIYDVAFHFRAVQKEGPDHAKNYDPALADELATLCLAKGLSVICVGHPDYSYCAKGCEDLRRVDLRESVAAICSVRVLAGENSGATHLANICGRPTILWANDQWRIDYSLRWNPFRVPIYTAANKTFRPEPAHVLKAIVSALEDLRRRTNDFSRPCYTLPSQPISNY